MVRLDSLETKPNSQTLTSSISLIHLSMPSKDHLLVMSYTSRIPWRETNDVSVQTPAAFKWMQLFAPHLSSAGVRAKDGAEPALSRGVPEERQHIKHSGLCSCKQINPSSAFGVNSTKQQASANRTEIWADFFLGFQIQQSQRWSSKLRQKHATQSPSSLYLQHFQPARALTQTLHDLPQMPQIYIKTCNLIKDKSALVFGCESL